MESRLCPGRHRLHRRGDDRRAGAPARAAGHRHARRHDGAGRHGLRGRGQPREVGVVPLARAHHGSVSKETRAQIEDDLKTGVLRAVVATSSLELGIDMGLVDLVVQVESPAVGRLGPAARGPRRAPGRRDLDRHLLPQAPRGPALHGADRLPHARGEDREAAHPRQPAGRAGPADPGRLRAGGPGRGGLVRHRAPGRPLCRAAARRVHRDAGNARRQVPVRRVRPAAPAHRLGPGHRHAHRTPRRPAACGGQRRHHPGPRALRRVPGGLGGELRGQGRAPGGRARRGNGLRVPGRGRVCARGDQLEDRGHHPRPGAGLPRVRAARQASVLEGRHPGPARGARRGAGQVHRRAGVLPEAAARERARGHRA